MTIRGAFLLLVVPLFLLLAGVNGALLFVWERGEAAKGLESQALAAAVTTAAFAASVDDLGLALSQPHRTKAMHAAAASVSGLDGLYLVTPGQAPRRLAGSGKNASLGGLSPPRSPVALPIRANAAGRRVATALAPAADGEYVIAQIDAEPMFAQVDGLIRLVAVLVAAAGLVGLLLAWMIASRIRRELARNAAMIAAITENGAAVSSDGLAIRETRDLGDAVRLMQTSVAGRVARNERELATRDRHRDEASATADFRETAFPSVSTTAVGLAVSVKMLGEPPAGAFYALCVQSGRAGLVLGECQGDTPAEALAQALAARRYFEHRMLEGAVEDNVELGRRAFALSRLAWRAWSASDVPEADAQVLSLLDGAEGRRAAAYATRASGLSADAIVADLAVLLSADGALAVLQSRSAEVGQG